MHAARWQWTCTQQTGASLRVIAASALAGGVAVHTIPALNDAVESCIHAITGAAPGTALQCAAVGALLGGLGAKLYTVFTDKCAPSLPPIAPPPEKPR